jgi:hypothetical protein
MSTREEAKRKVLTRFLLLTESEDCTLTDIADGVGVSVGMARGVLTDFGIQIASGVSVGWTQQQREDVEAYLEHHEPDAPPVPTTINNYGPAQVHTGRGDQTMTLTYGQVLQELKTEIEKCDAIPADEKKGLLAHVDGLVRHPLLNTVLGGTLRFFMEHLVR